MSDPMFRKQGAPPRLSARVGAMDGIKKPSIVTTPSSSTTTTSTSPLNSRKVTPTPTQTTTTTTTSPFRLSSGIPSITTTTSSPPMAPTTSNMNSMSNMLKKEPSLTSLMINKPLNLNLNMGGGISFGGIGGTKSPLARVASGHIRKGSRGASSSSRWESNAPSYQDYVDEELFYSNPNQQDDEEFENIRNLLNSEYSVTTSAGNSMGGLLKNNQPTMVLSWKGKINHNNGGEDESEDIDLNDESREDREQLENDQRDLQFIKEQLEKTKSLSNQMVFILDRFNEGLTELEQEVAPINASMKEWSTVYNNINITMDSIRSVLEKFDLSKVEQKIRDGAKGDYESYMITLEQIVQSIDFLSAHESFKSADKTLSTLKELKQTGVNELENNFKSLLVKISNLVDPTTIPPLPPAKRYLSIISPSAVEEISKSIELFSKLHYTSFLKEYKDKRSKFILLSLRKMAPEKFIKITTESKNLAYVKGTHPLIGYVFETLRLYQIESDLVKELYGNQYHIILEEVIDPSHELLLETAEPIIKLKKTGDRIFSIFPLLDLFETFTKLLPEFSKALSARDGKHMKEMEEILKNLESTCSSLLEFNLDNEFSKKEDKAESSTTVDEISSNMLNYFKRLVEYKTSVESLLSKSKSSFNEFLEKTLRGLIKHLQIKSKKEFTIQISEFKVPIKGNIFLINNYNYITINLKNANILDSQSYLLREFETSLENEIKIFAEFWNSLIEQLKFNKAKDDNKSIVKKHTTFLKSISDLSKLKFDIPDQQLKNQLKTDSKTIIARGYDKFKEVCRQDKIHLEKNFQPFESTEDINRKIDKLFDSQL